MRSKIQATGASGSGDLGVMPSLALHSEFLTHSAGLELFTRLREFISTTWGIDTRTSILCANEAVLSIEAQVQRRTSVICHRKCQGGLGMFRKQKVEKFIDANLDQRIAISGLASLVGLSSSQFQPAFKQSFGEATHMYLIKRRIEPAKTNDAVWSGEFCGYRPRVRFLGPIAHDASVHQASRRAAQQLEAQQGLCLACSRFNLARMANR